MSTKNRFLIELDGVAAIRATKVDGLDVIKHTPSKLHEGNRPNPHVGRGNYEVGEVTVNHAESLGQAGSDVFQWCRDFAKGVTVERRTMRVLQFGEDGVIVIAEYELRDCVPTSFKNDGMDAASSDHSFFTFAVQPEDSQRYN